MERPSGLMNQHQTVAAIIAASKRKSALLHTDVKQHKVSMIVNHSVVSG